MARGYKSETKPEVVVKSAHSPGPDDAAALPLLTKDEAIELAKQLRRDQGGERLLRYLRG